MSDSSSQAPSGESSIVQWWLGPADIPAKPYNDFEAPQETSPEVYEADKARFTAVIDMANQVLDNHPDATTLDSPYGEVREVYVDVQLPAGPATLYVANGPSRSRFKWGEPSVSTTLIYDQNPVRTVKDRLTGMPTSTKAIYEPLSRLELFKDDETIDVTYAYNWEDLKGDETFSYDDTFLSGFEMDVHAMQHPASDTGIDDWDAIQAELLALQTAVAVLAPAEVTPAEITQPEVVPAEAAPQPKLRVSPLRSAATILAFFGKTIPSATPEPITPSDEPDTSDDLGASEPFDFDDDESEDEDLLEGGVGSWTVPPEESMTDDYGSNPEVSE